eukprot:3171601-Pleurochrysis_carterae.AAC.1
MERIQAREEARLKKLEERDSKRADGGGLGAKRKGKAANEKSEDGKLHKRGCMTVEDSSDEGDGAGKTADTTAEATADNMTDKNGTSKAVEPSPDPCCIESLGYGGLGYTLIKPIPPFKEHQLTLDGLKQLKENWLLAFYTPNNSTPGCLQARSAACALRHALCAVLLDPFRSHCSL